MYLKDIIRGAETMSKKEMLRELLEKMDEKEAGLLYCFAIGVRAGSMEKAKNEKEGAKEHDV